MKTTRQCNTCQGQKYHYNGHWHCEFCESRKPVEAPPKSSGSGVIARSYIRNPEPAEYHGDTMRHRKLAMLTRAKGAA